jgi:hypothetical protein
MHSPMRAGRPRDEPHPARVGAAGAKEFISPTISRSAAATTTGGTGEAVGDTAVIVESGDIAGLAAARLIDQGRMLGGGIDSAPGTGRR